MSTIIAPLRHPVYILNCWLMSIFKFSIKFDYIKPFWKNEEQCFTTALL